jgi:hypothetical protein
MANGAHVEDAGRPRREHFVDAEQGAGFESFFGVSCFHHLDVLGQLIEEFYVVREISKEGLTQMDVRLNKTWENRQSLGSNYLGASSDL